MQKNHKRLSVCLALALALAALPAKAAEGRIPIWQPVVIGPGDEGKYILTRDLMPVGTGPRIEIQPGTVSVDIDLNGFTVYNAGNPTIVAAGADAVTIRNGIVWGGVYGIYALDCRKVVIEDVKLQFGGTGIGLSNVDNFAIRRSMIVEMENAGISVNGSINAPDRVVEGVIRDNQIRASGTGITLFNGSSVEIADNRIAEITIGAGIFISPFLGITGCSGCLIADNTIEGTGANGLWLSFVAGSKIKNNVVIGAAAEGIFLDQESNNNLVLDNVVSRSGSNGLIIQSSQNHVERNVLNDNGVATGLGWGLYFQGGSANTYRGNTAQGNFGTAASCPGFPGTTDFCNAGAGNVSPFNQPPTLTGDNLMPGLL